MMMAGKTNLIILRNVTVGDIYLPKGPCLRKVNGVYPDLHGKVRNVQVEGGWEEHREVSSSSVEQQTISKDITMEA